MANFSSFQGLNLPRGNKQRQHYTSSNRLCRCLLFLLLFVSVETFAQNDCNNLEQLSWLLGSWKQHNEKSVTIESWQRINEVTWQGRSTVRNKNTDAIFEEDLLLTKMLGEVFFLAKVPENSLPVAFKAIECTGHSVIFENKGHDFPQRLHYQMADTPLSDNSEAGQTLTVDVSADGGKGFRLKLTKMTQH